MTTTQYMALDGKIDGLRKDVKKLSEEVAGMRSVDAVTDLPGRVSALEEFKNRTRGALWAVWGVLGTLASLFGADKLWGLF